MTTKRKSSAGLTSVMCDLNEDRIRRTRDRMLVATQIADCLKAKGISQKRFAKMTGKSESEISEWLSGDRNFTIDTLSDIKKYLGLNLLNIPNMRTTPVSNDVSSINIAKRRTPVTYDMCDGITSSTSASWLPLSNLELSVAL